LRFGQALVEQCFKPELINIAREDEALFLRLVDLRNDLRNEATAAVENKIR
jgi:hypothetical protein